MADVSRGKDLVSSLNDTETRLKKVERQLAVPRRGAVSVTDTTSLPASGSKTLLSDSVTVVTTATCLIHFFLIVEIKFGVSSLDYGKVHLRDMEIGASSDFVIIADTAFNLDGSVNTIPTTFTEYGSQSGIPSDWTSGDQKTQLPGPWGPVTITNNPSWAKAAGKHTFNLVAEPGAFGFDIRKRKFFAWVQPF